MALYAVTIFLSAFLLFQIQPLIAKIILPWFGGSAAVWSASLLFFQLVLLAGYAYAHLSIRYLKARGQMMLHAALLLGSCLLLPILPNPIWRPTQAGDPTLRILTVLAVDNRVTVFSAFLHQSSFAGVVRAALGIGSAVPPLRALEFRIAARTRQFSVFSRADAGLAHASVLMERSLHRFRASLWVHRLGQ